MSTQPKALRLADALDAEFVQGRISNSTGRESAVELRRLHEALETEQKPVAWVNSLDFDDDDQEIIAAKDKGKLGTSNCDIPLYTAPKQWVGLTDKEVSDVIDDVLEGGGWLDVARALEAAIKRKNT